MHARNIGFIFLFATGFFAPFSNAAHSATPSSDEAQLKEWRSALDDVNACEAGEAGKAYADCVVDALGKAFDINKMLMPADAFHCWSVRRDQACMNWADSDGGLFVGRRHLTCSLNYELRLAGNLLSHSNDLPPHVSDPEFSVPMLQAPVDAAARKGAETFMDDFCPREVPTS